MEALIGRSIDEGETVHGADWNSLWWSAVGAGSVVPTGNMCKPEIATIEGGYQRGVRVNSGRVLYRGSVYSVQEQELGLMNNLGNEERYDLVYVKYLESENTVTVDVKIGEPDSEEAFHPALMEENEEIVAAIAVAHLDTDATEIKQLKDVRSVPNLEHLHRDGLGLYYDENYKANVYVDGETIKIVNDELTLGTLGGDELDLVEGEGTYYYEYYDDTAEEWNYIFRVEEGNGLQIGSNDEVLVTPSEVTGDGLEVRTVDTQDKIHVVDGDGLQIASGQLAARVGQGTQISSGKLAADVIAGRGAAAGSSGIEVITSDLAGSGLGTNSGNIEVNAGDGLQINGDLLEVGTGEGITEMSGQIGLDLQDGGGLGIDGNNALYADADVVADAGTGLYADADTSEFHIGAGDGLTISSAGLDVVTGKGMRINNGLLEPHVDPYGGVDLGEKLSLLPSDFAGAGLTAANGELNINPGAGMKINSNGLLAPNLQSGGGLTNNGKVEAVLGDFVGNWAKDWTKVQNGQIELAPEEMFNLIGEKTVTIDTTGQREGIWFTDYTQRQPIVIGIGFLDQTDDLTNAVQLKKVMEDYNSESGPYGNDFFAGVECVGGINGDPGSAEVLIRVYEVELDSFWNYNYE